MLFSIVVHQRQCMHSGMYWWDAITSLPLLTIFSSCSFWTKKKETVTRKQFTFKIEHLNSSIFNEVRLIRIHLHRFICLLAKFHLIHTNAEKISVHRDQESFFAFYDKLNMWNFCWLVEKNERMLCKPIFIKIKSTAGNSFFFGLLSPQISQSDEASCIQMIGEKKLDLNIVWWSQSRDSAKQFKNNQNPVWIWITHQW